MCTVKRGERIKPKQNDPKQTFTCDSDPKNLEYGSYGLMIENNNVYKTIRIKSVKNSYNVFYD